MNDFLPEDGWKGGELSDEAVRAFYALPATREEAERAYLGTLMLLRPCHPAPTVKIPDSAFSPLRLRILQAVRLAWPSADKLVMSERLHAALVDVPTYDRVDEIIRCLVQARPPLELDLVATHLLGFVGSEA